LETVTEEKAQDTPAQLRQSYTEVFLASHISIILGNVTEENYEKTQRAQNDLYRTDNNILY
jgi:hypothetical protein